jgi:hypothetical protein
VAIKDWTDGDTVYGADMDRVEQGCRGQTEVNTVAATGSTETLSPNYAMHRCTMDQSCTFTFGNPTLAASSFVLHLSGAYTPTFPASVDWSSGTAPTYTTPSLYVFTTSDTGTTWLGTQVGKAFA